MDKQNYRRITEIISPFSGIEFVPEDILKPAADRGTLVHKGIEDFLSGKDVSYGDEVLPYIESFKIFWSKSKYIFEGGKITLEKRMFCDKYKISGQADVIIEKKNRTYIIDWKTSKTPHKSWALQGAAYRYLAELNGYENVDSVLFVKVDKAGKKPTLYKHDNYYENLDIFFKCLELFNWFDMSTTRKRWKDF